MQTSFFGETIDLSDVDPSGGSFEPVPAGWYPLSLVDTETKKNNGVLTAKCAFDITDGPLAGRKVFENSLCLSHPTSVQANDIGRRKLRQWCDAVGQDPSTLDSMEPFIGQTVLVKVSLQPGREYNGKQYGPSNRVDAFKAYDGMPIQAAPAPVAQRPAPVQQRAVAAPVQQRPVVAPARPAAPAPMARPPAATGTANRVMPWNRAAAAN